MPEAAQLKDPEFKAAFLKNEQQERISTGKVASALVVVLMPVTCEMDPRRVLQMGLDRFGCAGITVENICTLSYLNDRRSL